MSQAETGGELARRDGFRRVSCRCGCGVWFYVPRSGSGRRQEYANADHRMRAQNQRRRDRWAGSVRCDHCGGTGRVAP